MAKTNQVKKLVNGEIADADDVNQIAENVGSEGGSIPYSDVDQDRDDTGSESLGSAAYPWGTINLNEDSSFNEIVTASSSVANTVLIKNLRRFLSQKDTPSTFAGQATKLCAVNAGEDAIEFIAGDTMIAEIFVGASSNWVCPAGVTGVYLTICGGGGGATGGAPGGSGAGGGGGAAYVVRQAYTVVPTQSYAYVAGAGGTGGAAGGGNGGNGVASTFDSTISLNGGTGATGITGGVGGVAPSIDGGDSSNPTGGTAGIRGFAGGNGGAGSNDGAGGGGGGSLGPGAVGGAGNGVSGSEGLGYGGGGSGADDQTGSTTGGAGGAGVIIMEYV